MYSETTRNIRVSVEPEFLDQESTPENGEFLWAYHIEIENRGSETVQLRTRHWLITDGRGTTIEVKGEGVVGQQPVLKPGQSFQYSSGTPLKTPSGFMRGSYHMEADSGEGFDVAIPVFSLDSPHERGRVH